MIKGRKKEKINKPLKAVEIFLGNFKKLNSSYYNHFYEELDDSYKIKFKNLFLDYLEQKDNLKTDLVNFISKKK